MVYSFGPAKTISEVNDTKYLHMSDYFLYAQSLKWLRSRKYAKHQHHAFEVAVACCINPRLPRLESPVLLSEWFKEHNVSAISYINLKGLGLVQVELIFKEKTDLAFFVLNNDEYINHLWSNE